MKAYVMRKIFLSFVIFTTPIAAQAAGFALIEQSSSGLGNAFAGAAASAEDASTVFFNPAGMTYIQGTQLVGAINLIKPNVEFTDQGSVKATGFPARGGNGGNAGDLSFIPNFYYTRNLTDGVKFGLSVNAPFGLKTEYDKDWIGRFQAIKTKVNTVNINPAISPKMNDQLSLRFGVSAMLAQAELTRAVNQVVKPESEVKIKGDNWGFGFNMGAIYQASTDTRFGIAYRSKVEQHLDGQATFGPALAATNNTGVHADLTLPENISVSAFSQLNDKWDLMGDVTWTRWSQFKELRVRFNNGSADAITPENWSNTMRYSIGASYHYSDTVKLRAGLAYDEEAISDLYRTARIPGNDRKWLSLGAGWQVTPSSKLDVAYAHLFINNAKIYDNQNIPASNFFNGKLVGEYSGNVNILSMQYTHNF